ncbi:MAG TPA: hypothetical protein PKE04_18860, partial [Clostridia bacterium]|nr:hypothetical protein [Clostridia bacterium]
YLRFSWRRLRRVDLALDGEFVIEKYLLLCVYAESMDLQGCFSNYEKNLDLCYELYRILYGAYPLRVKGLDGDGPFDREAFVAGMKALHKAKYDAFMRRWNIGHVDLFPGNSFYKDVRRRRPGRF